MSDEVERGDTYYEVQVDRETLVLMALGLLALVVAAFLVGRWTAPAGEDGEAVVASAETEGEPELEPAESLEDVDGEPLFGSTAVSAEGAPPVSPVPTEPVSERAGEAERVEGASAESASVSSKASAEKPAERGEPVETATAAAAGEGWVIQVAAVKSSRDASELERKLKRKGWPVRIVREGGLSKVQVGPYAERSEATTAERRLKREEGLSTWVKRS